MQKINGGSVATSFSPEVLHQRKLPFASQKQCQGMQVLYLFAGPHRKSSLGHILRSQGAICHEVDILRSNLHDLTKTVQQEFYLKRIREKAYDVVVSSPPCDTFSRAKMANTNGPRPTRDSDFPRGLPSLPKQLFLRNKLGNILADFSFAACLAQLKFNPSGSLIKEHPENLGKVKTGPFANRTPASIWQWKEHSECMEAGATSIGLRQADFGTDYIKPTRLLIKVNCDLPSTFHVGPPCFCPEGFYLGPIPHDKGKVSLARKMGEVGFRTTGTAAWPLALCKTLAGLLQSAWAKGIGEPTMQQTLAIPLKEPSTSSHDSFPTCLPPENFNRGGNGPCRTISLLNKKWEYHDGLGLTSPGRFDKPARSFPEGKRWDTLRSDIRNVLSHLTDTDVLKCLISLSLGRGDLFQESWAIQIRSIIHSWLGRQTGDYNAEHGPVQSPRQPFFLDLIYGVLREGLDPDFEIFSKFPEGVTLGVLQPLPRTPAIYEEQVAWRLEDSPFAVRHEQNPNYSSLLEQVGAVKDQFDKDIAEGRMIKMTKAEYEETYPPEARAICALAALKEKDKVRTLTDGTHHVLVNNRIKCRDQLRCPGPREKFFLLDSFREKGNIAFSLLCDVASAHRLVKVRQEEWGLMACVLDDPSVRYVNTVGTFGFSSAAYWFSRLMTGVLRSTYILLGRESSFDALLYADDLELLAETPGERRSIVLLVCCLFALGTPLKWAKFRGGFQVNWVGLHTCYRTFSLGLSAERAAWLNKWTLQCVTERVVDVNDFQSGLGRLNFATLALIFERPFLGILYAWVATVFRAGLVKATLPWAVAFILKWLGTHVSLQRLMVAPRPPRGETMDWFRADAKATDTQAFIGGWELTDGSDCTKGSRWFSLEIKKEHFGWAFSKGSPKKAIAALELLATLMCIKLFTSSKDPDRCHHCCITASTDNQGNSFIVSKMMTTKYPSVLLLIELTEELRRNNTLLNLSWRDRDRNTEADALTNGDFSLFSVDKRIAVDPNNLQWHVLPSLEREALQMYTDMKELKDNTLKLSKGRQAAAKFVKRSAKDKLRQRDPW